MYALKRTLKRNKYIKNIAGSTRDFFLSSKLLKMYAVRYNWYYHEKLQKLNDTDFARKVYKDFMGKDLNLTLPTTFDEKIWWLKINNKDPLITKCTDKYTVREYVTECGYSDILIPLVDVYEKVSDIDFNKIPEKSFLKCSHTSGCNMAYNDKESFDFKYFKKRFSYTLKKNHWVLSREWNYKNIKPLIVCEEQISSENSEPLLDFRFLCFNGTPKLLMIDIDTVNKDGSSGHPKRNIYDLDFKMLDLKMSKANFDPSLVEMPGNFNEMIEIARNLSKPFPFCRVDLYNVDGKIYFGEITFYTGGGFNKIEPSKWDLKLGDMIEI